MERGGNDKKTGSVSFHDKHHLLLHSNTLLAQSQEGKSEHLNISPLAQGYWSDCSLSCVPASVTWVRTWGKKRGSVCASELQNCWVARNPQVDQTAPICCNGGGKGLLCCLICFCCPPPPPPHTDIKHYTDYAGNASELLNHSRDASMKPWMSGLLMTLSWAMHTHLYFFFFTKDEIIYALGTKKWVGVRTDTVFSNWLWSKSSLKYFLTHFPFKPVRNRRKVNR